jgi:hypothetical protein
MPEYPAPRRARHATGNERLPEGQRYRDSSLPERHAETRVPEPGKRNKRHDLTDGKPADWRELPARRRGMRCRRAASPSC